MEATKERLLELAARIVSAQVGSQRTETSAVPWLIQEVYQSLAGLEPPAGRLSAANHATNGGYHKHLTNGMMADVQPGGDQLVCKDCGMSMKMLKRHIFTVHGMTPNEYREKWGLAPDYAMVTASYTKLRSALAVESGLGRRPKSLAR
jgi:predicted transcriptional regulator